MCLDSGATHAAPLLLQLESERRETRTVHSRSPVSLCLRSTTTGVARRLPSRRRRVQQEQQSKAHNSYKIHEESEGGKE